jgi:hypothetical protein
VIPGTFNALGISTFTAGMMMGTATTPYIVYYGTASVASGGISIASFASAESTNILSLCTLDNTFPTQIIGAFLSSPNQYVWANYAGAPTTNSINSNNSVYAAFVNFSQDGDYIPSTIFYMAFGN